MTDREILIRFIEMSMYSAVPIADIMGVADYLLERGVIVPLVNENDTVYIILLNKVIPFDVIYVNLYQKQFFYKGQHGIHLSYTFKTDDIGKTVFLTREEAEKALKENINND